MTETREKPDDPIVVLATAANAETLARLGRVVVAERLAACVTVVPEVRSIYRWKGVVEDERESFALIKTTAGRYRALEKRWIALHPYDVPEVLALRVHAGSPPYLSWLIENTKPDG